MTVATLPRFPTPTPGVRLPEAIRREVDRDVNRASLALLDALKALDAPGAPAGRGPSRIGFVVTGRPDGMGTFRQRSDVEKAVDADLSPMVGRALAAFQHVPGGGWHAPGDVEAFLRATVAAGLWQGLAVRAVVNGDGVLHHPPADAGPAQLAPVGHVERFDLLPGGGARGVVRFTRTRRARRLAVLLEEMGRRGFLGFDAGRTHLLVRIGVSVDGLSSAREGGHVRFLALRALDLVHSPADESYLTFHSTP